MGLDEPDGGEKTLPLQAVLVQLPRRNVRGGDQRHPAAKQPGEKTRQDHGVGDVRDEELVETQRARASGNAPRDELQGILAAPGAAELFVHAAHETVEVSPLARHRSERGEERIHQQGLAAADSSPQIQPARSVPIGSFPAAEPRAPLMPQAVGHLVELFGRLLLRGIELQPARGDFRPPPGADRLGLVRHATKGSGSSGPSRPRASPT